METRFLGVPGGRLAYDVTGPGDGPLVICTPGMGDTRKVYRFLTPSLAAAGYQVARLDLRGEGESSVGWNDYRSVAASADLIALARHLGGLRFSNQRRGRRRRGRDIPRRRGIFLEVRELEGQNRGAREIEARAHPLLSCSHIPRR